MKAASPIDNKEQKLLFLAVSQSEVHIDFDFPRPFFACPIGGTNQIACPKNWARRSNLFQL